MPPKTQNFWPLFEDSSLKIRLVLSASQRSSEVSNRRVARELLSRVGCMNPIVHPTGLELFAFCLPTIILVCYARSQEPSPNEIHIESQGHCSFPLGSRI